LFLIVIMGCTQSKATTEAINGNSNALKEFSHSKTSSLTGPVKGLQPDLTASRTVSSDDHDGVAPAVDEETKEGNAQEIKKGRGCAAPPIEKKDEIFERVLNSDIVSEEIDLPTAGPYDETQATKVALEAPTVQPVASEEAQLRALLEAIEQPQQPDDASKESIQPAVSIEPVVLDDVRVEQEEGAMPEASEERFVEAAVKIQRGVDAYPKSAKYCSGCFLEETTSGAFKVCAKCKAVSYCGKNCQTQHWRLHKKVCGKNVLDISSSHLQESELPSDTISIKSPRSDDSSDSFIELDASFRKSSVHEDAVRELEAVLRRLRSEEALEKDEEPALKDASDPVEAAREAILEEAISDILDCGMLEEAAPESPTYYPGVDENTPVLRAPRILTCAGCSSVEKKHGSFKSCAKCRDVFYCSKVCQKGHWKQHKKMCCKIDPNRNSLLQAKNIDSLNPVLASS
jgi:MYND finger